MKSSQLIPHNDQGKKVDLSEQKTFPDLDAAIAAFELAAQRLLHPQQWKELCGKGSASFELIRLDQPVKDDALKEGDYIRIDIPGPGPGSGDGYDWVKVAIVESSPDDDNRRLGIKLVPCANPESKQDQPSHFFGEASSSTLIVELKNLQVSTSYHGRNETVNNETGNAAENIRNTVIAAGALAGFSEWQWKKLISGLIMDDRDTK